jgi:hypothetical protein
LLLLLGLNFTGLIGLALYDGGSRNLDLLYCYLTLIH